MDRTNGAGHVGRMFVAEDSGIGRPPTEITDNWLNGVQEEIISVITDTGQVPNSGILNQLLLGIKKIFQGGRASISDNLGTGDAIVSSYTPAITTLYHGMQLSVNNEFANTSLTPTYTPDPGIAPQQIIRMDGAQLHPGDIHGGWEVINLQFDLARGKWILLNPVFGTATISAVNDSGFTSNDNKPVSSNWVRGAIWGMAAYGGFIISKFGNGYIKFPSWLGSFIIQWGVTYAGRVGYSYTTTFPIAFPVNCVSVIPVHLGADTSVNVILDNSISLSSNTQFALKSNYAAADVSVPYLAVGY